MKELRKIFFILIVIATFSIMKPVSAQSAPTKEDFDDVFGTISVNYNERDFYTDCDYSEDVYCINQSVINSVESGIHTKFDASTYATDYTIESIYNGVDIYTFIVLIKNNDTQADYAATAKVSYNDTGSVSTDQQNAMFDKIKDYKLPFFTYDHAKMDDELDNEPDFEKRAKIFERVMGEKIKEEKIVKKIKDYIGDSNVEVVLTVEFWATSGYIHECNVSIYKDDKFYVKKQLILHLVPGFKTKDGYPILAVKLEENEDYQKMLKELDKLGAEGVLYAYELYHATDTPIPSTANYVYNLDLDVGTQYNGKKVTVLHKKQDGSYEHFVVRVKNGKASITTTELSPFMVAVNRDQSDEVTASNDTSNPQTSAVNIIPYIIIAVLSLVGVIYLAKRKKRIA